MTSFSAQFEGFQNRLVQQAEDDEEFVGDDLTVDDVPSPPPKKRQRSSSKSDNEPEKPPTVYFEIAPPEILRVVQKPPVAFVEPEGSKPYAQDPADRIVPQTPSFITDFVHLGRGTESPTIFMLWGALWTLSTALNRNAWIQWYPKKMWPNLYIVLVAPAGLCKKSTPIDFGRYLLEQSELYWPDNITGFKNSYRFITSKASPAGIYLMLKPERRIFLDGGNIVTATRSSKVTFCISELATLLSRQQYMTGIIDDITNLYDCPMKESEITQSRGIEPLEEVYITLAGAITPTGLEESLPPEALKGGFISRTVIVYQDLPTKIYPRPIHLEGYPTPEEVAQRLAWIANNHKGEYYFTPEAEDAFSEWYVEWKSHIMAGDYAIREDEHRRDVTLRKLSMLLRVAEYRPGNEITVQNFRDAQNIMDFTLDLSARMMAGLGGNEFVKQLTRVRNYIEKKKTLTRRQLMNRYGSSIPSQQMTILVNQLLDQGFIVGELNGKPILRGSGSAKEIYTWVSGPTAEGVYHE